MGLSVLQDQCRELSSGDPAGEATDVAARMLREVELFSGNARLSTARLSEVSMLTAQSHTHTFSSQHLSLEYQLWLFSVGQPFIE